MMVKKISILYFAWVREKVGKTSETVELAEAILTITDLMTWLKEQDECYKIAFENSQAIKVAVNQNHVDHDFKLEDCQEIAFFPPVTGG